MIRGWMLLCLIVFHQGMGAVQLGQLKGSKAQSDESLIDVLIEIPAGSAEKWEVSKRDHVLRWERNARGQGRVIQYLPYPVNYGFVPKTLMARVHGGDGDALDAMVLGASMPKGRSIQGRVIAVLRLLDHGAKDDKLVVVPILGVFSQIKDLSDLDAKFWGVSEILKIWFTQYKDPQSMRFIGWGDKMQAQRVLRQAMQAFKRKPTLT